MSIVGRAALLLALMGAVYVVVMALASRRPGRRAWELSAERGVYAVFVFTSVAIGTMRVALVTDSFELRNVAEYSSTTLGFGYKLTALWGSQAGSLLLWAWILSGYSALVVFLNRTRNRQLMPVVMAVLMTIAIFFLSILSFVTSPFETLAQAPTEGRGLNPLLQNFYMQIHPPMLYLGYVGLSVPFAFAMAALVTAQARRRRGSPACAAGRSCRGCSSASGSCWAPSGPTRCWGGAATGPGTRSRTPPSCPGWWPPPSCTR